MTTQSIFILILAVIGIFAGYMMQIHADRIVVKKCESRKQQEQTNYFNRIIKKKETRIIISIINGMIWALIAIYEKNLVILLLTALIISLGTVISIIDVRIRIIPNELVFSLCIAGTLYQILNFGFIALLIALGCMFVIMAIFLFLGAIIGMDKIGAGDVKLAGAMGLVLGYPNIFVGILVMAIVILIYCFIGFALYKMSLKSMFPYAPFMMSGMTIALIFITFNINLFVGNAF